MSGGITSRDIFVWDGHSREVINVSQHPADDVFLEWLTAW
jgi:hypothetical protein